MMFSDINELRCRTVRLIAGGCWFAPPTLLVMALMGLHVAWWMIALSAALNIVPTIHALIGRSDLQARTASAIAVVAQPALIISGMQDLGWQVDFHLYFLVGMAALTAFCDIRPLILAASLVAAHHLILGFSMPAQVFSGGVSPGRLAIHALAVVMICLILCYMGTSLGRILRRANDARSLSEQQAAKLQEQADQLQSAMEATDREREARKQDEIDAKAVRSQEYREVATSFENSIRAVTKSVASTAEMLEGMTKSLDSLAQETGEQAAQVAQTAMAARQTTHQVAEGIGELSRSIARVAGGVSDQKELATRATERSLRGGQAMGSLTQHSDTIGEATRAIVRIAERTNLLSLNAAIEAASAGAAGRGFTIVAQEVKALAGQAAQAAVEIDDFLEGIRKGSVDAGHSFSDIDEAIGELNTAAQTIRMDVEEQRRSADTMEDAARGAADEVGDMADQSQSLAATASTARALSGELDQATAELLQNVGSLEETAQQFAKHLKAA